MLGLGHQLFIKPRYGLAVGDDANPAAVVGKTLGQQRHRIIFKHRSFDISIDQQPLAGLPVRAISTLQLPRADKQTLTAGNTNTRTG